MSSERTNAMPSLEFQCNCKELISKLKSKFACVNDRIICTSIRYQANRTVEDVVFLNDFTLWNTKSMRLMRLKKTPKAKA